MQLGRGETYPKAGLDHSRPHACSCSSGAPGAGPLYV